MTETELLHLLFQRAPAEIDDARLFRRNVGVYRSIEGKRVVHVGVEGQCDAYALLRGGGIVEIETKAALGRMSKEQRRWQTFCSIWRIPHVTLIAKKDATPDEVIAEWIKELRELFALVRKS